MSLLFKITYGLYLLSAKDGDKQNGCMVNTILQQTSTPERISVTVNKGNYTCEMIAKTGKFVANILNTNTPFEFVKNFGMQSGKNAEKFSTIKTIFSNSGIATNAENSLGFFELKVVDSVDLDTHIMFIADITQSESLADGTPLTYAYYQSNIKPKPVTHPSSEESWVCTICNYEHKGPLPADFICPICKHGANDFTRSNS